MGKIKFEEGSANDLPIGSHEPCKLVSVTYADPDEKALAKYPDLKSSWCFKFQLEDPDSEWNEQSAVRFVNHSPSKLGNLYLFCCDLNGGEQLEEVDPEQFVGQYFRVRVRKRPKSEKLHVQGVDPIAAPATAGKAKPASKKPAAAKKPAPVESPAGPDDSEIPF